MKKSLVLIMLSILITFPCFALEKAKNEVQTKTVSARQLSADTIVSKSSKRQTDFNFKDIFTDTDEFEEFMIDSLSVLEVDSPAQISSMISAGSKDLFVHKYLKETPLISEFLYQSFKEPVVISKFLSIFIQRNSLFVFSIAILFSIVLSYFLGEFKYKFPPLSFKRLGFSALRFVSVNAFRVWIFTFLFMENVKPITQVYMASIVTVKDAHPTLYGISSLISQYI